MRCITAAVCVAAVACGGSGTKSRAPDTDPSETGDGPNHEASAPDVDEGPDDGMEVEGLKGRLDPADIQAGIEPHSTRLATCFESRVKKQKYLGGKVELGFVVGREGEVKSVFVSQGDLGSWDVESCLLETSRAMSFPVPKGSGDADFVIPLDFPPRKQSLWWSEERSEQETEDAMVTLEACESVPSNVWVTLYVGPGGKVLSSGFASRAGEIAPEWASCATEAMSGWSISDPRGKIAKLGFLFNAE